MGIAAGAPPSGPVEDDAYEYMVQAIVDAEMDGPLGNRKGRGVLEQLILGRHEPSGFADLFSLAP